MIGLIIFISLVIVIVIVFIMLKINLIDGKNGISSQNKTNKNDKILTSREILINEANSNIEDNLDLVNKLNDYPFSPLCFEKNTTSQDKFIFPPVYFYDPIYYYYL